MKRTYAVAAVLFLAIAVGIPVLGAQTHRVTVNDNFYDPKDITVEKGDTVEWIWLGDNHSVTFDDGPDSGVKQKGSSWSRTFDGYGTFFYKCTVHGLAMAGAVIVRQPPPPTCQELGNCPQEIWVPSQVPTIAGAVAQAGDSTNIYLEPGTHLVTQTVSVSDRNITIRGARKQFPVTETSASLTSTQDGVDRGGAAQSGSSDPREKPSAAQKPKPSPSPSSTPSPSPSPSPDPSPSPSPSPVPGPVSPDEVIVQAQGGFASAFNVTGDGFSMESLTIRSLRDSAVDLVGAKRFRFESVHLLINREYGIRSTGSRFGVIEDVYVTGSSRAGISIQDCELCDVRVENLTAVGNFNGFEALDAGSVVLTGSTLSRNANGVVLKTRAKPSASFQDGVHVFGNRIESNGDPDAPAPSLFRADETQEIGAGAGIWVSGGWRNVVEQNQISGHVYGVAVTVFGSAAMYNRIEDNNVSGSTHADLGWDGLGLGNCFSGNSSGTATTDPPALQTTHACGVNEGPGAPNPRIALGLAETATNRYYCPEIGQDCPL